MRTSEERLKELHNRMDILEQKKKRRSFRLYCAAASAICLAAAVLIALGISRISIKTPDVNQSAAAASIFAEHAILGYVVTAVIALCLGILLTIFCFRLKKHMDEDREDDRKL